MKTSTQENGNDMPEERKDKTSCGCHSEEGFRGLWSLPLRKALASGAFARAGY